LQTALQRLDEHLAALSAIADQTPALVKGVARDVGTRFDASWAQMIGAMHTEGRTLSGTVSSERQAAVQAVDVERAAVAADAERIASQIIAEAGEQARRLIREALWVVIAIAVVLLGLPFAAGYLLGRARRSP
jgi:conjugal transfer/entry exclusion protein